MIRVLQCVNNMHRAGLETLLMNYYRNIDRTKIQFDFLMHRSERSDYDDEIEALGGRIYRAPRLYPQNYPAYFSYMKAFFREHPEYRIIHSHIDAMSYLPLLAAKKAGVPVRIAHSHSTGIDRDLKYPLKQLFRFQLESALTHRVSCGQKAGEFLFRGKDFQLIPNAIDGERFRFNEALRRDTRRTLGLEDTLVLGHCGRLTAAKNHGFLLEIFAQVRKQRPDAVLLLAGTGEKEQQIRDRAETLGLTDHVRFLGSRPDVDALYQAMDVFVMPSLYEGVPVVGIEAQFAGLPCVFSDRVPREVMFTDRCLFLTLEQSAAHWAEQILRSVQTPRDSGKAECAAYDIRQARHILEDYYMELDTRLGS